MSRRLYKLLIVILLFGSIFVGTGIYNSVSAEDYYGFGCNEQYEVSWITDDGKFQKVGCFVDFKSAKDKMKELGGDHVVRHASSLSPSKIIAMNSGNAYSYPARNKDNAYTLKIYQDADDRSVYKKNTYIANHYEMRYYDTDRYYPSVNGGLVKVSMNGFDGYVDLEYTDLVPSKFLDKGLGIFLGGNDRSASNEQPFLVVPRRDYFIVQEKDGYRDLVFVYHRAYCNPDKQNKLDEEHSIVIGNAPLELVTGVKYYSNNGYDFYTSPDYENKATTFYPYYQFLPLRTKTNLSADELNNAFNILCDKKDESVMQASGEYFIEAQEKYGINALLLYSMAVHESGWGTSTLAKNYNNLFGWNAIDSDPSQASKFPSIKEGILEHAGYNLRLYIDITDPRFFSMSLGNKGSGLNVKYASDPYWGMKIAGIAYSIDKVNSSNNELNDLNQYEMALVDEFDASFFENSSSDSKVMYKGSYGPSYQKDFIITKINDENGMTKVQSTNPIIDGKLIIGENSKNQLVEYNYDSSYVYLKSDILKPLNSLSSEVIKPSGSYINSLDSFHWDDNYFYVAGKAYVPGIPVDDANAIDNNLVLYNDKSSKLYDISTDYVDGIGKFAGSIDLSKLENGTYKFKIETKYSKYSKYNNSFELKTNTIPETRVIDGYKYEFSMSNGYITLDKSLVKNDDVRNVSSIRELSLNDDFTLTISGIAFRNDRNYSDINSIEHILEVIDIESKEVIDSFKLDTIDSNGFSLNDGFDYTYVGFKGTYDISKLNKGSYTLRVRVNNGDLSESILLNSTNSKYLLNYISDDETTYKLTTNSLYNYRLEFDVEANLIDYDLINKESIRPSILSFESLKLEDGKMTFKGYGYINKLNFTSKSNPKYSFYLVSDDGKKYEANAKNRSCEIDYTSIINNGYDLSNICFEGEFDLNEVEVGAYELYAQISVEGENGKYIDIFNLTSRQNLKYEPLSQNDKLYNIYISDDRFRMKFNVENIEE